MQQARQEAAALAKADPESPTPHLLLAGVLAENDLFREALDEARKAERLRPDDPGIRKLVQTLAAKAG